MSWFSDLWDDIAELLGDLFGGGDAPEEPPTPVGARVNIRVRAAGGGNVSLGGALVEISVRGARITKGTDADGWVHFENVDAGPRHMYVVKKGYKDYDQHFEVKAPDTTVTVAIEKVGSAPRPQPEPPPPGGGPTPTSDKVTALRRVAAAYLNEYANAHVGRKPGVVQPKQEAFVRRAAACLHYGSSVLGIKADGKTMLLGQRGGNIIAQDAVLYDGGYYDFIISAGNQGTDLNRITWHRGGDQGNAKAIQPNRDLVPKASGGGGGRRRSGVVKTSGEWLADADGKWYVLYATLFPAIWLAKNDLSLLKDTAQWLRARGVDAVRILGTTGSPSGDSWDGREWDSRAADFPDRLEHTIDVLWNEGLRTQLTIFGSDGWHSSVGDKRVFVDTCVRVCNGDREKMLFIEIANEYWHNSILAGDVGLVRELGKRANGQTDIPIALSTPRQEDDGRRLYEGAGAQVGTAHTLRAGTTGLRRDRVRHIPGFPAVRMDGEPRGIGASAGGDVDDPTTLANDLKESARNGINGYCFHAEPLIWFGLHGSKRRIWEEPKAEACLKAIAKARDGVRVG